MTLHSHNLFGDLTHQQFLDEYWQQKPLLIRQAFPDMQPPFSAEELAGLCCDTDAPARLIIEKSDPAWHVIQSPLEESHFLNLPESHWTLLVNDLERYYPKHLELLANFRFIPDWRIDDLMISYAPDGGSVGPHIDQYDVFLIQASGKRHWMLDPTASNQSLLPNIELKILADFNAKQAWTLNTGDMLYLPPNLAHYGIAQGDCMTYSVGFRSPSQQEMLESWLYTLADKGRTTSRYQDSGRAKQSSYGKIENRDIQALKKHLLDAIHNNDDLFNDWLGSFLTEPKNLAGTDLFTENDKDIDTSLPSETEYSANGSVFFRDPQIRTAWIENKDSITLFVDGEASRWSVDTKTCVEFICANYRYSQDDFRFYQQQEENKKLLQTLIDKKVINC